MRALLQGRSLVHPRSTLPGGDRFGYPSGPALSKSPRQTEWQNTKRQAIDRPEALSKRNGIAVEISRPQRECYVQSF